jgi:hypothetical protein
MHNHQAKFDDPQPVHQPNTHSHSSKIQSASRTKQQSNPAHTKDRRIVSSKGEGARPAPLIVTPEGNSKLIRGDRRDREHTATSAIHIKAGGPTQGPSIVYSPRRPIPERRTAICLHEHSTGLGQSSTSKVEDAFIDESLMGIQLVRSILYRLLHQLTLHLVIVACSWFEPIVR